MCDFFEFWGSAAVKMDWRVGSLDGNGLRRFEIQVVLCWCAPVKTLGVSRRPFVLSEEITIPLTVRWSSSVCQSIDRQLKDAGDSEHTDGEVASVEERIDRDEFECSNCNDVLEMIYQSFNQVKDDFNSCTRQSKLE